MVDNRAKILIVDDEPFNIDYLEQELEELAYETVSAENGLEALEQVAAENPDVILLDIMMPEMDGFQVLERLKADKMWRDIPVIVISAMSDISSVTRGIKLGAEDYLPKPFDEVLLKARIEASLEKKRFRDQEVEYLHQIERLIQSAAAVENNTFDPDTLSDLAQIPNPLGQLARVFQQMAREVYARETQLKRAARERESTLQMQLRRLRVDLDDEHALLLEAFDNSPPFDHLTLAEKKWLVTQAQTFSYPDNWLISGPERDDSAQLFLLLQGQVAIQDVSQTIQGYIEAPAYFGERSIFLEQSPTEHFVAKGSVQAVVLSGQDIKTLTSQNSMFRQAFATTLRTKQRIFYGYDAFVNQLQAQADESFVRLQDLVMAYRELNPILHRGSQQEELDFSALGYIIPRLPENITSALTLCLAENLPLMYRPVSENLRSTSQRARKREFYDILPNKIMILLRDRLTDTVDILTKLCIYAVEIGKIQERLSDTPGVAALTQHVIRGGSREEAQQILAALPFAPQELGHLKRIFGDQLPRRLYEILAQGSDLSIHVQKSDHRYEKTASELWLSQIRTGLWRVLSPEEFDEELDVHIISSNTHSVHNCLSSWLNQRTETILTWAKTHVPAIAELSEPADQLYFASRAWFKAHATMMERRLATDQEHGIFVLDDVSLSGIEVRLIDMNRLGEQLDPHLGCPDLQRRTLLVNIDYAYGQQAELIIRNLILLFGQRIRSISVFGKSGAIVGRRGDLLLPDRLLLQTDDQLYPLINRGLRPADFAQVGCDLPVHEGTLLTVLGTIMQSREMLYYYRHFWNVIGMEMEGSFYLREILRAHALGLISQDIDLRFAYYTSDTPLDEGASLASKLAPQEGIPAVYGITRAVLQHILKTKGLKDGP